MRVILQDGSRKERGACQQSFIFRSISMASTAAVSEAPATRFAKDQLKAIIERIERLEEEKKTISDDIRDVYADERREHETILDTYMQALGML
jgi:uncharacterized protein (UPF0335 family)